jgi:hypothetical protein
MAYCGSKGVTAAHCVLDWHVKASLKCENNVRRAGAPLPEQRAILSQLDNHPCRDRAGSLQEIAARVMRLMAAGYEHGLVCSHHDNSGGVKDSVEGQPALTLNER